jgi:hypothetical protein
MTAFGSRGFAGAGAIAAGFLLLSVPSQVTAEEQPVMRGAIEHLRKAEAVLQRAISDKGGQQGQWAGAGAQSDRRDAQGHPLRQQKLIGVRPGQDSAAKG